MCTGVRLLLSLYLDGQWEKNRLGEQKLVILDTPVKSKYFQFSIEYTFFLVFIGLLFKQKKKY